MINSGFDSFDFDAPAGYQEAREAARRAARRELFERATEDCRRIVAMNASESRPRRIYLWGSLIDADRFDESSDIDIAVEGLAGEQEFLNLQGVSCQPALREFPQSGAFPANPVPAPRQGPLQPKAVQEVQRARRHAAIRYRSSTGVPLRRRVGTWRATETQLGEAAKK